ncbi:hypothetical protein R078138_00422 [Convivina praedatoris]|uniref:Uncharacterized protein n=1 Tax=Convivina praedatoris TaxID=2880963 RepID=A0ABM9D0J3_9LACO|nr:hypothetical protein LMG032447_00412 [Convivina sp. LMG 32447]CAH1851836.1 hypothetical protein R078138_00422 [Convivina sp. LMG 32447]CAH1853038.1 hypothetical protein R077815_00695 [Convivina sp. LMG 32447]
MDTPLHEVSFQGATLNIFATTGEKLTSLPDMAMLSLQIKKQSTNLVHY